MSSRAFDRSRRSRYRQRRFFAAFGALLGLLLLGALLAYGCGSASPAEEGSSGGEEGEAGRGSELRETTGNEEEAPPEDTRLEATGIPETTEMTETGGERTGAAGEEPPETEPAEEGGAGQTAEGEEGREGPVVSDTLVAGAVDRTGGPLVENRLVMYYGHPFSGYMGVLGQLSPEELVPRLQERADTYTQADPDRPALPAIELIASVAQPEPGPDGLYLNRTPTEVIEEYATLAEENDLLLVLDVQIAHSTIAEEVEALRPFLEREHVHLAIDPEWDMAPGQIPGQVFGSSDGSEIAAAAGTLQQMVEENDLPPKILVVHQFQHGMITNKHLIEPLDDVAVVLHADGFGVPEDKVEKYDILVRQEPIQYGGFKLFYDQDVPLMTPEQVLEELDPNPAIVSYQ